MYSKALMLQNIRYIIPAVHDLKVEADGTGFVRRAPRLNYAKASQRWWIHVEFDTNIDLYVFEKTLGRSGVRLVELGGKFYVEDPRMPDSANMGEVSRLAETFVAQLNGVTRMLCPHFHSARIASIIELLDNGTGRGITSRVISVHGTSDYPAIKGFLNGDDSLTGPVLAALKSNSDVQDALFYLGAEGNIWSNLYKVTEIVAEGVGGEESVFQKGWCSRSKWKRFRRTANHQEAIGRFSRHARLQAEAPSDPMTSADAQQLAAVLVRRWVDAVITEARKDGAPTAS